MARGKKRPIAELIEAQNAVVEKKTQELKKARETLKALQEQEKSQLMEEAVKIAAEKGMSVSELLRKLK